MSVQAVAPVPEYPFGQGLQTRPPGVFMQVVSVSQPPFAVAHSSMSTQIVLPVPVYPEGQSPHVAVPETLVHVTNGSQPP
jgi:hypothetical protein